MASVFIQFVPNQGIPFNFVPVLNGTSYGCTVTWNNFGLRWYINLTDSSGNPILSTALNSTPAALQAQFNWTANGQTAIAVCSNPHNVRLGAVVPARVTATSSAFNGDWKVQAADRYSLIWVTPQPLPAASLFSGTLTQAAPELGLPADEQAESIGYYFLSPPYSGYIRFIENLVAGVIPGGWLLYHADTQQFEYDDNTGNEFNA